MLFTVTRLLVPLVILALWVWLGNGTAADPANVLLLLSFGSALFAFSSIRRYWHIRNTSRSRKDSSLFRNLSS